MLEALPVRSVDREAARPAPRQAGPWDPARPEEDPEARRCRSRADARAHAERVLSTYRSTYPAAQTFTFGCGYLFSIFDTYYGWYSCGQIRITGDWCPQDTLKRVLTCGSGGSRRQS